MNGDLTSQAVVNNEYDYSNIVPTVEEISYIVRYCDEMNKQLQKLVDAEEEKNKQFKSEYREYMYSKSYTQSFEVYIKTKGYTENITCNDYEHFASAVQGGNVKNLSGLDIKLCMNFKRGKGSALENHENSFYITFKPYDIKFTRNSNHNDPNMNQVEQQINELLKKFQIANSIFCSK